MTWYLFLFLLIPPVDTCSEFGSFQELATLNSETSLSGRFERLEKMLDNMTQSRENLLSRMSVASKERLILNGRIQELVVSLAVSTRERLKEKTERQKQKRQFILELQQERAQRKTLLDRIGNLVKILIAFGCIVCATYVIHLFKR